MLVALFAKNRRTLNTYTFTGKPEIVSNRYEVSPKTNKDHLFARKFKRLVHFDKGTIPKLDFFKCSISMKTNISTNIFYMFCKFRSRVYRLFQIITICYDYSFDSAVNLLDHCLVISNIQFLLVRK